MNYSNSNGLLLKNITPTCQKKHGKSPVEDGDHTSGSFWSVKKAAPYISTGYACLPSLGISEVGTYTSQMQNYYINNLEALSDRSKACQ